MYVIENALLLHWNIVHIISELVVYVSIGTQQVQSGILPQTGFFLEALEISQHFSRTSLEDAATPASGPLAESASKTTGRGKLKFRF